MLLKLNDADAACADCMMLRPWQGLDSDAARRRVPWAENGWKWQRMN